ncbi:probable LRR receptor-like serine/threonine-protein kinase At3g47570 [Corylus avellana]|uniref:probable LRR receptor-like serine/threonine-protein kinase At3g47570 n=1 Tax=Corylus avellana TaxID=13451 RepID=UPI00286BADEA|nr:probable LRR receptor-like serine/threonine-protein kinase At3g47570 [Corylus avellana]
MISYQELCQGTNNFCESNLLGARGFGFVYKGMLFDGTIVAIKVINLQLSGAFKSFDVECKVLQAIRHRNLVKVISTCSNLEFKALVLQYMSNGSLERWLYSYNYYLNLIQRVNIMVDVASALDYLHHGQSESVVHCDLKPSNILLDEDMIAHVGDFGIAKILVENEDATQTQILGTLVYIAPEYGFQGKASIKCDIYSYGIILLEMISRKKPTDDMFVGELTLRQWINMSFPDRIMEVVDEGLLKTENGRDVTVMQNVLSSIIELGLMCSKELPYKRVNIKDVLDKLKKIKRTLFENKNYSCMLQLAQSSTTSFTDQAALIAFKSKLTSGPNQTVLAANWSTATNFCNWNGSCSRRRQRVTALNLSYMGLKAPFLHILYSKRFWKFRKLEALGLGGNILTGNIPPTISNLSRLFEFAIEENNIKGSIPSDLWRLSNLGQLLLQDNYLTGTIPQSLFNISSLQIISLVNNSLYGNLPSNSDFSCPSLERLAFGINKFSGLIPSYLSNCSKLAVLDLSSNILSGPIPKSLGQLKYLRILDLEENQLTGEPGDQELNFLSSFSNCRVLEDLSISYNPLDSTVPDSIGNFSTTLHSFLLFESKIKGHIPMSIGFLKNLTWLGLGNNNLTGNIPSTIGGLEGLQRLELGGNKIQGFIPEGICELKNLGELNLSHNKISGSIPNCISNLNLLQKLFLDSNKIESSIPINLWSLENLLFLDLSSNFLGGYLSPNMKKLHTIERMDLSRNKIIGDIPSIIGAFESLNYLNLSKNSFQGEIPQSFRDLKGLDILDLSYNDLSGAIPKSLETLSYLKYLNVSFNKLSGEIPSSGPYANFTAKSFLGNKALCGNLIFGVLPCPSLRSKGSNVKQSLFKYFLPAIASIILCLTLVYMLRRHRESKIQLPNLFSTLSLSKHRIVSYQELCQGTNNFCESNLLGAGGFGSVYKGVLLDGTVVAIKVLNLQLAGAFKSFDAECKVLRTIRHRNLVKVISTCSNPEFRALVLQYMSNGSLERWLYSYNYCLNLLQRVNIMVDVASALDYLHHGLSKSVVHCDLKPTNILLDEDMVAPMSDFGIAKILIENKDATQTKTLGTLGYIAREYGFEGKVSIKGDVYSYGITLLEMITRKKPTDNMFEGELTMRQWINASLPDRMMEVVDDGLLRTKNGRDVTTMQSVLSSIMELGLRCSEELPNERVNIKDVLVKLQKIKLALSENRNRGI